MAKLQQQHSNTAGWAPPSVQKRWLLTLLIMLSVSTLIAFFIKSAFDSCDPPHPHNFDVAASNKPAKVFSNSIKTAPSPLSFMKSKLVLLVSHELSLSGTVFRYIYIYMCVINSFVLIKERQSLLLFALSIN